MVTLNNIQARREDILRIAARHGASVVRVFGSVARGKSTEDSDVDILVHLEPQRSLLDHIALMHDLEDLLGCKVDVVEEDALDHRILDRVLSEAVAL